MDLDDSMLTVFCLIDASIPTVLDSHWLRQRGPTPTLAESEVVTREIVGAYLGVEQERALFAYFRHHYAHCFPALRPNLLSQVLPLAFGVATLRSRGVMQCSPVPYCARLSAGCIPCPAVSLHAGREYPWTT
jgi:hypothetical protein